jgi:hypothetical protein
MDSRDDMNLQTQDAATAAAVATPIVEKPAGPTFFNEQPRWMDYPALHPSRPLTWLWQGYIAAGNVTLITSQWKTGKTTLLSLLLSRMRTGGALCGFHVAQGNALVISEEAVELWDDREQRLNLRDQVCLLSQPFSEGLTDERWIELLDWICDFHLARPLTLVVIDTLASFLPTGVEHDSGRALRCLSELRRLTRRGLSVVLAHHPRKGLTLPGQASRGTGALPAYVDILIEMQGCASDASDDRRRRLRAFSRHSQTPRDLVIEWTPDGADYEVRHFQEEEFTLGWEVLRIVMEDAKGRLTRLQVMEQWPVDHSKPSPKSLWRWLDRAWERGLIQRDGAGRCHSPFRYWLPGKMEQWLADPMAIINSDWDLFNEIKDKELRAEYAEQERRQKEWEEEQATRKREALEDLAAAGGDAKNADSAA